MNTHSTHQAVSLGDFVMPAHNFFDQKGYVKLAEQAVPMHEKIEHLFRKLTTDILAFAGPVFLLPSIIALFELLVKKHHLPQICFSYYEFWLNQLSGLSQEDNYKVRSRICGKYIPRDHYQLYFPIGQNKSYFGSHFVTAHASPDLDTTVASFWGWIDAFAARVGEGLHHWNVPGGAPSYQVEFKLIFDDIFSSYLFPFCAKHRNALQISSLELVTQKGIVKRPVEASSLSLDVERSSEAVVLIDAEGYYQGDWRTADVEGVRQVVMLVNQTLRHFENHFQQQLIALFSKEDLKKSDLKPFISSMLSLKLADAEPLKEISERQKAHVNTYLKEVLNVHKGLEADIKEMAKGFSELKITTFSHFIALVQGQLIEMLFDGAGSLIASRSELFKTLDKIIVALDEAIRSCRRFVDQLSICLEIKAKVFGYKPLYVLEKADVEELRAKMGNSAYLTVVLADEKGLLPIGVIYASDLYKPTLGTVTLRDFSNREETKVPSYLEVISVIDHHKSQLSGLSPATIHICDVQSSNTKVASLAFSVNDQTSSGGMTKEQILAQLGEHKDHLGSPSQRRLYRKLLQRLEAIETRGDYFIDPLREYVEYHQFLFAILDDTDFLSKVSYQDVEIVKELLNRMKSLLMKKELEVVHFDDIAPGAEFTTLAAQRLLKNADLFSITQKIYTSKERFIDQIIERSANGQDSLFFADTKEQNGCVKVGQFKLYPSNYNSYVTHQEALQQAFIQESKNSSLGKKEIDLHLFMISTLAGLEPKAIKHLDEIWVYVPEDGDGGDMSHLRFFFNNFIAAPACCKAIKGIRLLGNNGLYEEVINSTLMTHLSVPFSHREKKTEGSLIVIDVVAGSMNSRKAMITPYLPKLIT